MLDIFKARKHVLQGRTVTLSEMRVVSSLVATTVKPWKTDTRFTLAFDSEQDLQAAILVLEAIHLNAELGVDA